MFNYIFSILFLYFFIGLLLFILQRKVVFNTSGIPKEPEDYGLRNINKIIIETSDFVKLLAWFHEPQLGKPVLIYFHGNSYDIGERSYRIKKYIDNGWGVLLLSWRGYSGNPGKPTEKNLYKDGIAALSWLKKNHNIKNENIILYGESLGSGVAVELGTREKYKFIVLEAPFTSIPDVAKKKYFIYPVKHLTLDKFDNISKINKIFSPLLIIHGKKDEVVPYHHSLKLFEKAKNIKKHVSIDEAMHNNLYDFNIDKDVIKFNNFL